MRVSESTAMTSKLTKLKGRRESGHFLALPLDVAKSPAVAGLSGPASKLLLDFAGEYELRKNGAMTCTRRVMAARGWTSNSSLAAALREVLDVGLIEQVQQGGLHLPARFAFSWLARDVGGDLLAESNVASGAWRKNKKPALLEGRNSLVGRPPRPSTRAKQEGIGLSGGPAEAIHSQSAALLEGPSKDLAICSPDFSAPAGASAAVPVALSEPSGGAREIRDDVADVINCDDDMDDVPGLCPERPRPIWRRRAQNGALCAAATYRQQKDGEA